MIYPALIGRNIGHPLRDQLRSSIRPGLVTIALFGAAAVGRQEISTRSWPVLIVGSAVTGLIALGTRLHGRSRPDHPPSGR